MKKILFIISAMFLLCNTAFAQISEEQMKADLALKGIVLPPGELKALMKKNEEQKNNTKPSTMESQKLPGTVQEDKTNKPTGKDEGQELTSEEKADAKNLRALRDAKDIKREREEDVEKAKKQLAKDLDKNTRKIISKGGTLEEAISESVDKTSDEKKVGGGRVFGHQLFRDKQLTMFRATDGIKATDDYVLDVGDEISVNVWGRAEFSGIVQVVQDGYLKFNSSIFPRIYVKGMKWGNVKEKIVSQFGRSFAFSDKTQIDMQINHSRTIFVNIVGEVINPGSYTISSINTAPNALVAADGPNNNGSVRQIKISTAGKPDRILDLYEFLFSPKTNQDFQLQNNDYIYVPPLGRTVALTGAFNRPATYELLPTENLTALMKWSGGPKYNAYKNLVQVYRYENQKKILIDINLNDLVAKGEDFPLKDGDRIDMNNLDEADFYTNYAEISGAVKLPGSYAIEEGKTRISDFIDKAMLTPDAFKNNIYLRRINTKDYSSLYYRVDADEIMKNRNSSNNMLLNSKDQIMVFSLSSFRSEYEVSIDGAVRKPLTVPLTTNLTLRDVLFNAGGLKFEADNTRVEVSRVKIDKTHPERPSAVTVSRFTLQDSTLFAKQNDSIASFLMQPYDKVYVRYVPNIEYIKTITLSGEILYPGTYTLTTRDDRISTLIERAGGITNYAYTRGAIITRDDPSLGTIILDLDKALKDTKSPFNYLLKDGDVVSIPRTKDNMVSIEGALDYMLVKEEIAAINSGRLSMAFQPGKNPRYYIDEYGGGVDRKVKGRYFLTKIKYQNGAVRKTKHFLGLITKFPKVEPGCVMYVGTKAARKRGGGDTAKPTEQAPVAATGEKKDWFEMFIKISTISTSLITTIFTLSKLSTLK